MHEQANKIVLAARAYVGCRYRHQGRDGVTGLDCAGLVIKVGHDAGITSFDSSNYPRRPNSKVFRETLLRAGCLPRAKPEHGDILRMASAGWPVHIGVYEVDENGLDWVIHAYLPAKKVIRERFVGNRKKSLREVMRYPIWLH